MPPARDGLFRRRVYDRTFFDDQSTASLRSARLVLPVDLVACLEVDEGRHAPGRLTPATRDAGSQGRVSQGKMSQGRPEPVS